MTAPMNAEGRTDRRRRPVFGEAAAETFVFETWGLQVEATEIEGDLDRNFRLQTPEGVRYLLKVCLTDGPGISLRVRQEAVSLVRAGLDRMRFDDGGSAPTVYLARTMPDQTGRSVVELSDGAGSASKLKPSPGGAGSACWSASKLKPSPGGAGSAC